MVRYACRFWFCVIFVCCSLLSKGNPSFSTDPDPWVDSLLSTLTLEEKIGQLFMVTTYSNQEEKDYQYIESLIRRHKIGGLIFMQGSPEKQVQLINRYQAQSNIPLMISMDAEWGLNMRLKRTKAYPKNMTLGAIQNDSLLYLMGRQMAKELRRVGVHVNFAPVVDVNNNANNPVINYRSFGENRYRVARKGIMISNGMQDQGVIACAKHFPGHGDTDTDSHYDLPIIKHDLKRLDSLELYPFSKLINSGVKSVMVSHLYIPSLDSAKNVGASLSPKIIGGLLREKMGYDGLIFTDALNMKGVTKYYPSGEVSLRALMAGNDFLLSPVDVPKAIRTIGLAVSDGRISEEKLDRHVRRILKAKGELGLKRSSSISAKNLNEDLNSPEAQLLRKRLFEAAMTIAKNDGNLLPLDRLEEKKIAYVQIGGSSNNSFVRSLRKYAEITPFFMSSSVSQGESGRVLELLEEYNTVIIGIRNMSQRASRNYGLSQNARRFCEAVSGLEKQSILTLFGNPYALKNFGNETATLLAYEETVESGQAAAAALFGGIPVSGKLPVSASAKFKEGQGFVSPKAIRFGFSSPEERGMNSRYFPKIDSIANTYVRRGAMPGCAILVMKGNDIVYEKAFGKFEYTARSEKVDPYLHTYDLASVTKIAATTISIMKLEEEGKLDLDKPISTYLPELRGSNKASLSIRRLLQHNAGLPSWAPLYKETFSNPARKTLDRKFYSSVPARSGAGQISTRLYATDFLEPWLWEKLKDLEVRNTRSVRYSDIGLIYLARIVEKVSGKSLDTYCEENFYQPMGMSQTLFNPSQKRRGSYCPPTEIDNYFRNSLIKGYVHDPTAAMMGGVAGHAGLFSNVYDMGKLMLMLKNGGVYGGKRYLKKATIDTFTRKQLAYSRKGLGWDKPETRPNRTNPVSENTSVSAFGHTGFTGTSVWADPQFDLVFVFLSNRTYPYAHQRKLLMRENVRVLIMDQLYESIFSYKGKKKSRPLFFKESRFKRSE
ncbi:MAG: glycoside hydrolase family 3 N-terminal domain-containing protein [Bacteroidota bacterium]